MRRRLLAIAALSAGIAIVPFAPAQANTTKAELEAAKTAARPPVR
jgi:hypothetical protein